MRLFLVHALVLLNLGLAQGVLIGRASVVDGDTLEVQGVRVRLWGIDLDRDGNGIGCER
jgi:endonuclease YncB( thermonuclease family)